MPQKDPEKRKEYQRKYHIKNRKKIISRVQKWAEENRDRSNILKYKHHERHPEKRKARQAVNNALRDGRLIKDPCAQCGSKKTEAHHEDYSKPLEVIWLCKKHHIQQHFNS